MNTLFEKNMGRTDRVFRVGVALALLVLAFSDATGNAVALLLGTVSVILLATSAAGSCPLYSAFGRGSGPRPVP